MIIIININNHKALVSSCQGESGNMTIPVRISGAAIHIAASRFFQGQGMGETPVYRGFFGGSFDDLRLVGAEALDAALHL
ncbi:MAG: hypothetical protein ACK2UB_13580, partial [Anaerolineales bacterium]